MRELKAARHYINYFLPREVLGPVILVFSIENIIDGVFRMYMPAQSQILGWVIIAILTGLLVKEWGEADEDIEDFEEDIEEIIDND